MTKRKKLKEITLPMKFNPGLAKYEAELPISKSAKRIERKTNWWAFVYILIALLILAIILSLTLKKLG